MIQDITNDFYYAYKYIILLEDELKNKIPIDLYEKIEKLALKSGKNMDKQINKNQIKNMLPYGARVILKYVFEKIKIVENKTELI